MDFNFKIVTPEEVVISTAVEEVMLGGSEGYFTIFADHSPFISRLAISTGYYKINDEIFSFSIKGGFCNVENNEVTVITSTYIKEEIKKEQEAYDKTIAFATMDKTEVDAYFMSNHAN